MLRFMREKKMKIFVFILDWQNLTSSTLESDRMTQNKHHTFILDFIQQYCCSNSFYMFTEDSILKNFIFYLCSLFVHKAIVPYKINHFQYPVYYRKNLLQSFSKVMFIVKKCNNF